MVRWWYPAGSAWEGGWEERLMAGLPGGTQCREVTPRSLTFWVSKEGLCKSKTHSGSALG